MTGRGDGRLLRPSKNPLVSIGLTLSTSPPILDPTSTEPFYIVLTARILHSPQPETDITMATHMSPFDSYLNWAWNDAICTTSAKKIAFTHKNWPHYICDPYNLREYWDFITIPAQGTVTVKHEIPRDKIVAAEVKGGEVYRVSLTNKCLGTRWWKFGSLEELGEGTRFMTERPDVNERGECEGESYGEKWTYGGKWMVGEEYQDLALVPENGEVEFKVLSQVPNSTENTGIC